MMWFLKSILGLSLLSSINFSNFLNNDKESLVDQNSSFNNNSMFNSNVENEKFIFDSKINQNILVKRINVTWRNWSERVSSVFKVYYTDWNEHDGHTDVGGIDVYHFGKAKGHIEYGECRVCGPDTCCSPDKYIHDGYFKDEDLYNHHQIQKLELRFTKNKKLDSLYDWELPWYSTTTKTVLFGSTYWFLSEDDVWQDIESEEYSSRAFHQNGKITIDNSSFVKIKLSDNKWYDVFSDSTALNYSFQQSTLYFNNLLTLYRQNPNGYFEFEYISVHDGIFITSNPIINNHQSPGFTKYTGKAREVYQQVFSTDDPYHLTQNDKITNEIKQKYSPEKFKMNELRVTGNIYLNLYSNILLSDSYIKNNIPKSPWDEANRIWIYFEIFIPSTNNHNYRSAIHEYRLIISADGNVQLSFETDKYYLFNFYNTN